jgi:hypothetical protein
LVGSTLCELIPVKLRQHMLDSNRVMEGRVGAEERPTFSLLMRWLPIKLGVGLASSFATLHMHVSWSLFQYAVKSRRSFYLFLPCSGENPKISWNDDAEVGGNLVAVDRPSGRDPAIRCHRSD